MLPIIIICLHYKQINLIDSITKIMEIQYENHRPLHELNHELYVMHYKLRTITHIHITLKLLLSYKG